MRNMRLLLVLLAVLVVSSIAQAWTASGTVQWVANGFVATPGFRDVTSGSTGWLQITNNHDPGQGAFTYHFVFQCTDGTTASYNVVVSGAAGTYDVDFGVGALNYAVCNKSPLSGKAIANITATASSWNSAFTGTLTWTFAAVIGKKARISIAPNPHDYSVTVTVKGHTTGTVYGTMTLAPGNGVITDVTVTNTSDTQVDIYMTPIGVSTGANGNTYVGTDNQIPVTDPTMTAPVYTDPAPSPDPTTPTPIPQPKGLPGTSTQPSAIADNAPKPSVWAPTTAATTTATTLDKDTFKEGIGKLEKAIGASGGAVAGPGAGDVAMAAPSGSSILTLSSATVDSAKGLLPPVPTFPFPTTIGQNHVFGFDWPYLKSSGHNTWVTVTTPMSFDYEAHASGITFLRTMELAIMSLGFFFLSVRTIRHAFAG